MDEPLSIPDDPETERRLSQVSVLQIVLKTRARSRPAIAAGKTDSIKTGFFPTGKPPARRICDLPFSELAGRDKMPPFDPIYGRYGT